MLAFSTDDFRPAERFSAFNEEFSRRFMRLDEVKRQSEGPYHAQVDMRLIGPLVCSRLVSAPVDFERVRPSEDDDSLLLSIHTKGLFRLQHGDETWDSRQDFATLTTDAHIVRGSYAGEALALRIPQRLLAARLPAGHSADPVRIRGGSDIALLMASYLRSFLSLPPSVAPSLADTVAAHVVDLVALALGASGEAAQAARTGGLREARRHAVLDEIAAGYLIPGYSADAVARSVGISDRYLRQLLAEIGTTFTDLILDRRLDHARRLLSDPGLATRKITDIAYDAGFSDLSYFNRAFRRRYSLSPRQVRAQALGL